MSQQFLQLLSEVQQNSVNLCIDSRKAAQGDLFIAVPGVNEDGNSYIPMAVEKGAQIIVCREETPESRMALETGCRVIYHKDPREALWQLAQARYHTDTCAPKVIGITGTNGKTTTAFLLEHVLSALGYKVGVIGTVSYRWPGHFEKAPLTTPDALCLHGMLHEMSLAGVDYAVMEVSSHSLEQQRVGGIPFIAGIFTNLTQDHLDFHKDMESYFKAKSRLFLECSLNDKLCVINSDDDWGKKLLNDCGNVISFGFSECKESTRHMLGKIQSCSTQGLDLQMSFGNQQWNLQSPLIGAFNGANLLGVQALLLGLGMNPSVIKHLSNFSGVSGRMERVQNEKALHVFVDYAHTPDALIKALRALREAGFKKIITVFGCGGNRDKTKRPIMGKAVAEFSDIVVLTSDNPRKEDPQSIINDVIPGLSSAKKVYVEIDRHKATALALSLLQADDALLIAGKGHEDYQIIGTTKYPYSDQQTVRELLA